MIRARRRLGGQAVDPAEEVQVFLGGQVLIEGKALGHVADVLFDPVVFPDDVEAAHPAGAAGGQQQAVQHADGGGFARAVGPQKAEDLPLLHLEADVVHRLKSPEMAGEILDDYGRFGWHNAPISNHPKTKANPPKSPFFKGGLKFPPLSRGLGGIYLICLILLIIYSTLALSPFRLSLLLPSDNLHE